jgi:hypothetical protein
MGKAHSNTQHYDGLFRLGSDTRNLTKRDSMTSDHGDGQKILGAQKGAFVIFIIKYFIYFNLLDYGLSPAFACNQSFKR